MVQEHMQLATLQPTIGDIRSPRPQALKLLSLKYLKISIVELCGLRSTGKCLGGKWSYSGVVPGATSHITHHFIGLTRAIFGSWVCTLLRGGDSRRTQQDQSHGSTSLMHSRRFSQLGESGSTPQNSNHPESHARVRSMPVHAREQYARGS